MNAPPILITGGSGQIGTALVQLASARDIAFAAPGRDELDLCNPAQISDYLSHSDWSAIINCAAFTAVDRAESEADLAKQINTDGPAILARETAIRSIPIVHVSTDYVFDGMKSQPYTEADPIKPLSVYGRTKVQGETVVRNTNPRHAIVRTAWVQSVSGANFINTMITRGLVLDEMRVVDDQIGCPSSADDIAKALLAVATNLGSRNGTWHFVNSGRASWHELATYVFKAMDRHGLKIPSLRAIPTTEYPTPAHRPQNSRLCTKKFEQDFGITPRHWHDAIDEILAQRLND